jgi:hypothetical protein
MSVWIGEVIWSCASGSVHLYDLNVQNLWAYLSLYISLQRAVSQACS